MTTAATLRPGRAAPRATRRDPSPVGPAGWLGLMARRGAAADLTLAADGTRAIVIRVDGGITLASVPYAVFREAEAAGWLAPSGDDGGRWTLSPAGRLALRRLKSAAGAPAAASVSRPPVAPPTAPSLLAAPLRDPAESPLAWLRRHKDRAGRSLISAIQLEAGDRLRADFWQAEMTPRVTVDWSAIGGGGKGGAGPRANGASGVDLRDSVASAQQRVRRALSAVSPVSAGLLIDVCGHLVGIEEIERRRGWPVRSGKIALQMALAELARHYRLPGSEPNEANIASRLRHWGADGYRPPLDSEPF